MAQWKKERSVIALHSLTPFPLVESKIRFEHLDSETTTKITNDELVSKWPMCRRELNLNQVERDDSGNALENLNNNSL